MKKTLIRLLALLLALVTVVSFAACQKPDNGDGDETTTEPSTTEAPIPEDDPSQITWSEGGMVTSYGTYPKAPGTLIASGGVYYSSVITVAKKGTTVMFTDSGNLGARAFVVSSWKKVNDAWVPDAAGANFIAGTDSGIATEMDNGIRYVYTTSKDNEHLRFCTMSVPADFTIGYTGAKGSFEAANESGKYPVLQNLRWTLLGDSYFDPQAYPYTWSVKMNNLFNGTMFNHAKSGSTVSNKHSDENKQMVTFFEEKMKADENPQMVLIEGGRNDSSQNVLIGEISKNNKDKSTFAGALNVILESTVQKYPDAMIVLVTCWNFQEKSTVTTGLTYIDYVNAMKGMAELYGVYVIDASNPETVGVNMRDDEWRKEYSHDWSHLKENGMDLVMPRFAKILAEYYTDFLSKK